MAGTYRADAQQMTDERFLAAKSLKCYRALDYKDSISFSIEHPTTNRKKADKVLAYLTELNK